MLTRADADDEHAYWSVIVALSAVLIHSRLRNKPPMMKFDRRQVIQTPESKTSELNQQQRFEPGEQKRKTLHEHTDPWQQQP